MKFSAPHSALNVEVTLQLPAAMAGYPCQEFRTHFHIRPAVLPGEVVALRCKGSPIGYAMVYALRICDCGRWLMIWRLEDTRLAN